MKKIDLNKTVAILANVGVIAGIVFLAIEIQQNTRSLEVNAYQELMNSIIATNALLIEYPEANTALGVNPELVSIEESIRINYFWVVTRQGDLAFYQYEQGMLSMSRMRSSMGPLNGQLCTDAYQEFWTRYSSNFVLSYREYLDAEIGDC